MKRWQDSIYGRPEDWTPRKRRIMSKVDDIVLVFLVVAFFWGLIKGLGAYM